jgi:hypothetical protein
MTIAMMAHRLPSLLLELGHWFCPLPPAAPRGPQRRDPRNIISSVRYIVALTALPQEVAAIAA